MRQHPAGCWAAGPAAYICHPRGVPCCSSSPGLSFPTGSPQPFPGDSLAVPELWHEATYLPPPERRFDILSWGNMRKGPSRGAMVTTLLAASGVGRPH